MRVLVCGGTGFIGHSLVPLLHRRGHEVALLSRRSTLPPRLQLDRVRAMRGDLLSASVAGLEIGEVDAVILLASPPLFAQRQTALRSRQLRAELIAIHANAIEIARRRGCPIILTGAASFKTVGEEVADERRPVEHCGTSRLGESIEAMVENVVAAGAPKVVCMLLGQIYGPGGRFEKTYQMAKRGLGTVVGDGSNCVPRVHVDDCASAYVAAIEHLEELATGERFIVADDLACTARQFADALAELCHAPAPWRVPALAMSLLFGRALSETLTVSCRVSNAKAKRVLGWAPGYPTFREGLAATVAALERGEVLGEAPGPEGRDDSRAAAQPELHGRHDPARRSSATEPPRLSAP